MAPPSARDALSDRAAVQLERCFDRLEIVGGKQHDVVAPVPSDLDTLVRRGDVLGDLG